MNVSLVLPIVVMEKGYLGATRVHAVFMGMSWYGGADVLKRSARAGGFVMGDGFGKTS